MRLVTLSVIAFRKPSTMLWFDKPWIFWSLAASMLCMGLTLSIEAGLPTNTGRRAHQVVMLRCGKHLC